MRGISPIIAAVFVALALPARAAEPSTNAVALSEKQFTDARKIYIAKCAKCHEFYVPSSYKAAEWETWMTKMGRKSKLTTDQLSLLRRYTETLRATDPPRKK